MRKNPLPLVISLILITGILPLILYSSIVLRAPSIDIQEASRLLGQTDAEYVLVDVRKAKDFERIHLEGASSLPLAKIIAMESISDIPPS
ncbi:MAG: rhodanese-like domain-containing protein, partial [Promethearchaeota archaeon]